MDLYIQAWDLVKFDFGGCVLAARPNIIIVPSATRLKMSRKHPKIRIFSLADKKWMRSRNEYYKVLSIPVSGPDSATLAGAVYQKGIKTNVNHSRSIRRNREGFLEAKAVLS